MDYAILAQEAADLVAEFGQSATVRRVISLGYDPGLTITVDATGKTFARSSGSWIVDGFLVGDTIAFTGFVDAGNNGSFIASKVEALVLTCSTATGLVNVTDAAGVNASANQDSAVYVLEQDINSIATYAQSLIPGSSISESTRFFMLSGGTPRLADKLIVGSSVFVIEAARPFSPGATVIYYTVRVKA